MKWFTPPRCGLLALALALALTVPARGSAHEGNPVVVVDTSLGTIKLELFADKAPVTVKNFLRYVDEKFYDGTVFHRVIDNFMIQGGGLDANLKEKPAHAPIRNEAGNGLSNLRGTVAIARTNVPDSATSQFYLNVKDNLFLDRARAHDKVGYAVFGRVIAGMDVIDQIRQVKTANRGGHANVPVKDILIRSVRRAAELTLVVGGAVTAGKRFTITAYVAFPVRGQSLTLELPPGVERVEGDDLQPVAPALGTSLVVWKARALRPGTFAVTVRSSTGTSRSQTVKCAAPPGAK